MTTAGRQCYSRDNMVKEATEVMKLEPLLSLNELSKKIGHSQPIVCSTYRKIRSSDVWKVWVKDYQNRVNSEDNTGIDKTVTQSDLRG